VKTFSLVCLLLIAAAGPSGAQGLVRLDSAALVRGARFGTWTLAGAEGKTVAFGGWSAIKASDRWTGAWRANVTGRGGEYSGSWTSSVDLKPTTRFAEMFEKAAQAIVSGTWSMGTQTGAWSIRAGK